MSRRSPRPPARFARAWLAACAAALAVGVAAAQPGGNDPTPPLPARGPDAPADTRHRIDRDKIIFAEITDDAPLQNEAENVNEYFAWAEVVGFPRQQNLTAADLEKRARRDLTIDDLTFATRRAFKLDLVRFDGTLVRVDPAPATAALRQQGVETVYQGWLAPAGELPGRLVCVAFTELPPGTVSPAALAGKWVSAAGYVFKLMRYPPADAGPGTTLRDWKTAPLLVARSVTPGTPPAADPATEFRGDKTPALRVFGLIRDDAKIATMRKVGPDGWEDWEEVSAFDRVVWNARKYDPAELERRAKARTFAELFTDTRADHKLELVKTEGRLLRVVKTPATGPLVAAGVPHLYEAWVVPQDELRLKANPVCVLVSEIPDALVPAVETTEQAPPLNHWVTVAGYSFKLLRYVSKEADDANPGLNKTKRAPLLIGRTLTVHPAEATDAWSRGFVPAVTVGFLVLLGTAGGLTWWFRRGDRRVRAEIAAARGRNPFADS